MPEVIPQLLRQRIIGLILLALSWPSDAAAQQTDAERVQTEQQLDQINTELAELARLRERQNTELNTLQTQAQQTALARQEVRLRIETFNQQQQQLQTELGELGQQAINQQQTIQTQQRQLTEQLRNAYTNSYRSKLQTLLSRNDTDSNNAQFAWQAYFVNQRGSLIDTLQVQQAALDTTRQQIIERQSKLEALIGQLQNEKQQLDTLETQQRRLSDDIRQQLSNLDERFSELQLNQQQLETLLEALRDLFVDIPDQLENNDFSELRGQLPWPVGETYSNIVVSFGSERTQGIKWSGIVIECPEDTTVKAVAPGRVAFADWMRGFGWLLVIEHNNGYMSLYGNNNQLLQSTGSWVRAGEAIATSGSSFTAEILDGVYFELRQEGKALNPGPWLKTH